MGYEHLDEVRLINMTGRMYDSVVGRFLSTVSYVQAKVMPANIPPEGRVLSGVLPKCTKCW